MPSARPRGGVVLTGRTGVLAAAGSVLVAVATGALHVAGWVGLAAYEAALGCVVAVDAYLAATLRDTRLERSGDTTVRLGERATVTMDVANAGNRALHGTLRDAWTPSAEIGRAHV